MSIRKCHIQNNTKKTPFFYSIFLRIILQIFFKLLSGIVLLSFFFYCRSTTPNIQDEREFEERNGNLQEAKIDYRMLRLSGLGEWNAMKEGFLDSSTFQVKVSSLKTNRSEALEEATDVAKRKCLRMLVAEANPNVSDEGRIDLKILIEEYGKIFADTEFLGEKYHFVFQIKRPALEIIVKEKIK